MARDQDKERSILDAARKVFVRLGPVKARMQDIAAEADITPSLLHYYFRSRADLYQAVCREEVEHFAPKQAELFASDRPLLEKLQVFAERVIEFHASNPHHAAFVVFETHYNPEHTECIAQAMSSLDLDVVQEQIDAHVEAGEMEPVRAEHLFTHVLSLCIFPFVARHIFQAAYGMDDEAYTAFLDARRETVPQFIAQAFTSQGAPE